LIPYKSLDERIGLIRSSLENLSDSHSDILHEAAGLNLSLCSGQFSQVNGLPLWIKLLESSSGLGQVSEDWIEATDRLLAYLGYAATDEITSQTIHDPELAIKLGLYDLAIRLNEQKNGDPLITLRALVHTQPNDPLIRDSALSLEAGSLTRAAILASLAVAKQKVTRAIDHAIYDELEAFTQDALFSEKPAGAKELLRKVHVLNSLNFLDLFSKKIDCVRKRLALTKTLLTQAPESETKAHAMGNWYFHNSVVAKMDSTTDQELLNLLEADRIDWGFTGYKYRIAQLYHDRGDLRAKGFYEDALKCSPMFKALVNDYGCFLDDCKLTAELESWAALGNSMFPEEKEAT